MESNSKHPKSKKFVEDGLFDEINEFSELEDRISKITPEKTKGDAFEVFVEAYLATQRKHDAESVWPSSEAPNAILRELMLPKADMGVDGIFKTSLGRYSVYQVKFRTGRPPLTWREISTFMGLSDGEKIENRVLITNSDSITDVVSQRNDFFCIRGTDFDRLTVTDFNDILSWIKGERNVVEKKTRLGHQIEAVEAICGGLKSNSRVTATMACGTGKTMVALWTAEDLGAKTVLILFPSLSLIRQTLHEWLKETRIDKLSYICVCSDATVAEGADMPTVSSVDLDFRVTTSHHNLRKFLKTEFEGTKMVFSTYQSAQVVGQAMSSADSFDLAIFDEAHKTAGREGRNLTFALQDKNINIKKRVFLTATPRHYRPQASKRERPGEENLVFSMDRPEVYGPRVYNLPFSRAIEIGIICKYKVIISAITSDRINAELLDRGIVNIKGDEVHARQVANQIAICDAVNKYGVKKIFTFHSKVASARSFVAESGEGISGRLPGYIGLHVNGEMSASEREKVMKEFRAAPAALISNARCLTEGVDVPAVDMVAFLSPRKSIVDIVQAAGRAMRKSDSTGKKMGYILVPLYVELESGETVDEAVRRADYNDVWEVLNSLMEHDDVLHESIRLSAQRKQKKGSTDTYIDDLFDFGGPSIDLEALRETIATYSIEALYSGWDIKYGELIKFKEDYGHCNVPAPGAHGNTHVELGSWVASQRSFYNKGLLNAERVKLLEEVGFIFDYQSKKTDQTWNKWYEELKRYKSEFGHCRIPRTDKTRSKIASWVWIQRIRKDRSYGQADKLTNEQVSLLDEIDFAWDPRELSWEVYYEKILKFFNEYGHSLVRAENKQLCNWCALQRSKYGDGTLSDERVKKLSKVKFILDDKEYQGVLNAEDEKMWASMLDELREYKSLNGHCDVPVSKGKNYILSRLANWVVAQRVLYKKKNMVVSRIKVLEALGFKFAIRVDVGTWEDRFLEAKEFIEANGHCDVPKSSKEFPKLEGFVNNARVSYKNGTLSQERIDKLNSIYFNWSSVRNAKNMWLSMFEKLKHFKDINGLTAWPTKKDYPSMALWVHRQRQKIKTKKLSAQSIDMLTKIGFADMSESEISFRARRKSWETHFAKLEEYRRTYGHVRVPRNFDEDPTFGQWVTTMRHQVKTKKLSLDKIEKLIEIGIFEERENYTSWETHFAKLEEYRRTNGHVRVPKNYDEDPTFVQWVATMRHQVKTKKLSADKIEKLTKIGILEESENYTPWESHFARLEEYRRTNGHVRVPRNFDEDPTFGQWVATMRHQVKTKKLSADKIEKLIYLGILNK